MNSTGCWLQLVSSAISTPKAMCSRIQYILFSLFIVLYIQNIYLEYTFRVYIQSSIYSEYYIFRVSINTCSEYLFRILFVRVSIQNVIAEK